MTDTVVVSLISGASMVLGGLSKMGYDRLLRNGKHTNGNGVENVIARRAEIEFQTRMTLLLNQLTAAIERGHEKSSTQMESVADAVHQAANAMRDVHAEIVNHQRDSRPAIDAVLETHRLVKDLARKAS